MQRILPSTRDWPLFDVAASRRIETRALGTHAGPALMQRAGLAVARLGLAVAPHARRVWIAAGHGHNGGDGLEAAVHLARSGRRVDVALLVEPGRLAGAVRAAFEAAVAAGATIHPSTDPADWPAGWLAPDDLAIDALLGIGANRAPDPALASAIRWINAQAGAVLAVDLPSGLNADTGQLFGTDGVVATHTLSLLCLRPGLFTGAGRDHVGSVWWDGLGVDASADAPDAWLSASRPAADAARRHSQHKGSFGDVVVVGGATGMTGAALLAGRAAHAAGAGRVFVHLLQDAATPLAADPLRPELMFRGETLLTDVDHLARATIVCGCGGSEAVGAALGRLLGHAGRLVIDADALNAVATEAALADGLRARSRAGRQTVLTPHPLEAARLLGRSIGEVQADRLRSAACLAERFGCTAVLKGSGSIVAAPARTPHVNASGNPSLASAGTGDVLAGWLGGVWARSGPRDDAFETAVRAVAQHGAAADPDPGGSLRAGDLIEALHRLR